MNVTKPAIRWLVGAGKAGTNIIEALSFLAITNYNKRMSVSLRETAPKRYLVWLVVVLAHAGLIAAIQLLGARLSHETRSPVYSLSLLQLPNYSRNDITKIAVPTDVATSHPSLKSDLLLPPLPIDNNAITLSSTEEQQQHIDWARESALAVQSSIAQATKEKNYRDLSGLTAEQLEWVKNNHMEPVPGFQWDRNSRGEILRHGIVKLNDYCVLIVVIPFCWFGGKIQYRGDLFKDMHDPKSPDQ
ncbi:MAG: hypothetical protein M3O26_15880 [Pseudomonadota bacterium]|nr:hypothetical protein [Pseudomonadota bacterium]